jgi:hypothetical protein
MSEMDESSDKGSPSEPLPTSSTRAVTPVGEHSKDGDSTTTGAKSPSTTSSDDERSQPSPSINGVNTDDYFLDPDVANVDSGVVGQPSKPPESRRSSVSSSSGSSSNTVRFTLFRKIICSFE